MIAGMNTTTFGDNNLGYDSSAKPTKMKFMFLTREQTLNLKRWQKQLLKAFQMEQRLCTTWTFREKTNIFPFSLPNSRPQNKLFP